MNKQSLSAVCGMGGSLRVVVCVCVSVCTLHHNRMNIVTPLALIFTFLLQKIFIRPVFIPRLSLVTNFS